MGHVCVQAKSEDDDIHNFAEEQRAKYRMYSGKFIAIGKIGEMP